ncbi:hypothetical protein Dsin_025362 [Dipteronia sinensis]|uniref:Uncharacterized protein n=1 Tax=Dipteronia sinensis TaxID=43782 RepID=A0AAD9ZW60_9ROSI|nr:hypothetical protein Dsin_025362 [Dipteronia sinensis]
MKHQNGDGSLAHDSKRTIGEKLRQAYDAAVVAVAGDRVQQSGRSRSGFERIRETKVWLLCGRSHQNYDVPGIMEPHIDSHLIVSKKKILNINLEHGSWTG